MDPSIVEYEFKIDSKTVTFKDNGTSLLYEDCNHDYDYSVDYTFNRMVMTDHFDLDISVLIPEVRYFYKMSKEMKLRAIVANHNVIIRSIDRYRDIISRLKPLVFGEIQLTTSDPYCGDWFIKEYFGKVVFTKYINPAMIQVAATCNFIGTYLQIVNKNCNSVVHKNLPCIGSSKKYTETEFIQCIETYIQENSELFAFPN